MKIVINLEGKDAILTDEDVENLLKSDSNFDTGKIIG